MNWGTSNIKTVCQNGISDAVCELRVMSDFKLYLNEKRKRLLVEWEWKSDCSVEVEERLQFDIYKLDSFYETYEGGTES